MQGKIALEEHFAIPETAADSMGYFPEPVRAEVAARNADIHGMRLQLMDEYGIEMMLLSSMRRPFRRSPTRRALTRLRAKPTTIWPNR